MFFSFLGIYGLISPPTPISMLKNVISVLREMGSSKYPTLIRGNGGKKWGSGGKITGDRSRDVFQNIFAHDCLDFKSVTSEL